MEKRTLTKEEYEALSPKEKARYRHEHRIGIPSRSLRKILEDSPLPQGAKVEKSTKQKSS